MSIAPDWSVVVATRRRPNQLRRCLESVRQQEGAHPEIIVVDNSSGDATTRDLTLAAGGLYMQEPVPSLSRARTAGARAARGEFVAFIDDDGVADPRWLMEHRRPYSDPAVGATTGSITPLGMRGLADPELASSRFTVTNRQSLDLDQADWFERANFGGIGNGGNMTFRRQLFVSGWGFHEDLGLPEPMGGEENYAFYELIKKGWRIEYAPAAEVRHPVREPEDSAYRVRQARSAATYVAFLLVNANGHRLSTVRYAMGFVAGRNRDWRPIDQASATIRRQRMPLYALVAPAMYLKRHFSVRRRLERTAPPEGPLLARPSRIRNTIQAG